MDREKVLHGLNSCGYDDGHPNRCGRTECPYRDNGAWCTHELAHDAGVLVSALLKAQEPRLLTLDEIHDSMVVYLEAGTKLLKIVDDDGVVLAIGGSERIGAKCFITVWDVGVAAKNDEYNITWRAWSERPTKEQREKEPWNRGTNDDQR